MTNKSNWKGSESKAARLFPGGKRRTRVGGGTYAEIADDVVWGPEHKTYRPPRIVKEEMLTEPETDLFVTYPPVYIEVKKRAKMETVSIFRQSEKKYFTHPYCRLALVLHSKYEKRQFVVVSDEFFKELIRSWCRERNLFLEEMDAEK